MNSSPPESPSDKGRPVDPGERELGDLRAVLAMSAPIVVATISRTVMSFVDFVMVSRLGTEAQAAVGTASIVLFVAIGAGIGVMACVNTFASQALGRGRLDECSSYAWQAVFISLLFGGAMVILWPATPALYSFIAHKPGVRELEIQYTQIGLVSIAPSVMAVGLANFFNGIHRPRVTMISAIGANLFNVVADYGLIFGEFGLPAMGVAGAALATVLATLLRSGWLLAVMLLPPYGRRFASARTARWSSTKVRNLLRIGLPSGAQFAADVLAWTAFVSWLIGRFGTNDLAATTIVFKFTELSFMPTVGVGIALTALVGKAVGQGRPTVAIRRTNVAWMSTTIYMGAMAILFVAFRERLIALFNAEPAVIGTGATLLIYAAIFQIFDAMCITHNSALRGAGDTRWPAVILISYAWLLLVGLGYLLARFAPQLGSSGPWIACTIYIILLGVTLRFRWARGTWRRIDIFREKPEGAAFEATGATPAAEAAGESGHGQSH